MNKQNKIVLSVIGLAALIVPAILLIIFSAKTPKEPPPDTGSRSINSETIQKAVKAVPSGNTVVSSPFVSTKSASPKISEGTSGAR